MPNFSKVVREVDVVVGARRRARPVRVMATLLTLSVYCLWGLACRTRTGARGCEVYRGLNQAEWHESMSRQ